MKKAYWLPWCAFTYPRIFANKQQRVKEVCRRRVSNIRPLHWKPYALPLRHRDVRNRSQKPHEVTHNAKHYAQSRLYSISALSLWDDDNSNNCSPLPAKSLSKWLVSMLKHQIQHQRIDKSPLRDDRFETHFGGRFKFWNVGSRIFHDWWDCIVSNIKFNNFC